MSAALNNEKEFEVSPSKRFHVHIKDLGGQSITITCTHDTPVSYLIDQFRQKVSSIYKTQLIFLFKEDEPILEPNGTLKPPLDVTKTLKNERITRETRLFAIYKWISCMNPEPIAEYLHQWIENNTKEFTPKFNPIKATAKTARHPHANITTFLAKHNKWDVGEEHLFYLTNTQIPYFNKIQRIESTTIGYVSDVSKMTSRKVEGIDVDNYPSDTYVDYYPNGVNGRMDQLAPNNISIQGTLDRIEINIKQTATEQPRTFIRSFKMYVILKGPIEIETVNIFHKSKKYTSDHPDAMVKIPYDFITMCSPVEQNVHNNSHGGKRRTKRTQKKRNIRQRTYKKQS